jgi:hypothetical protein
MPQPVARTGARTRTLIAVASATPVGAAACFVALPAAAAGTTHQAESAALAGGAVVGTDDSGYTGTGFVEDYTDANKGNTDITFTVAAAAAGSDTDWNTWTTETETVTLRAGSNTIAYKYDTTGNVNLDNIVVAVAATPTPTPTPTPGPAGTYEAEYAFVSGGPTVATTTTGFTGTGYVTGCTAVGARVIVTANMASAGSYTATTRYANSSGSAKSLTEYVNGLNGSDVSFAAGTGWLTVSQTLTLRSGVNLIEYPYNSGDSGSIDIYDITGGSTTANYVTVTGAASGGLNNPGGYTIVRGAGDTGW